MGFLLKVAAVALLGWLLFELGRALVRRTRASEARRERARALATAATAVKALPGGAPERPVVVSSASVVEARAERETCPICDVPMRIEGHSVDATSTEEPLRVVALRCRRCRHHRPFYVRIEQFELH